MAPSAMHDECLHMPEPLPSKPMRASTILASVLHGPKDIRTETRILEPPAAGELQIAIRNTGICGSDVSYYKRFANGDLCACSPLSLGHESSGVVVAIGPSCPSKFSIGDRVALEVGVPCGTCGICRQGRYNLCKKMRFRSSAKSVPHFQGTLQERINHPAEWCFKLPDHVSFDAAALLEPLSVGIHAVNRAAPTPGSTAVVLGSGTVGLLTAAMARQSGVAQVTIVDVDAGRVNYALKKGFATHGYVVPQSPSINSSGSSTPASGTMTPLSVYSSMGTNERIQSACNLASDILAVAKPVGAEYLDDEEDEGADVTFECTGKEACMQTALYTTKPGGKVIMVGMGTPIQTLPVSAAHLREVDILGIFRYCNTYPTGIRMLANSGKRGNNVGAPGGGLPSLDDMVTHRVKGLENAKEAFELAGRTCDDEGNLILKVVVEA